MDIWLGNGHFLLISPPKTTARSEEMITDLPEERVHQLSLRVRDASGNQRGSPLCLGCMFS